MTTLPLGGPWWLVPVYRLDDGRCFGHVVSRDQREPVPMYRFAAVMGVAEKDYRPAGWSVRGGHRVPEGLYRHYAGEDS